MIYLDYSANTPVDERVLAHFCEVERRCPGNANARHQAGRAARAELDAATQTIRRLLDAPGAEVIYTSGASEANNLAIKGLAARAAGRHLIATPLEHSSAMGALDALQAQGWTVDLCRLCPDGTVDLEHLRQLLRPETALVVLSMADSELGTVQPVAQVAELLRSFPACRLHVDATQAVGKMPVSFAGADTMSLTAHKFYGLNGSGLLLKRPALALEPLIHGGQSTTPYRSGTPTVALASSLAYALELAVTEQPQRTQAVRALSNTLRSALSAFPNVRINSPESALPHILNLSVQGIKGTVFQRALDAQGVCVSVRSACASDGQPSRAVYALTGDRRNALSSWRISLSHLTTRAELDEFLHIFGDCCQQPAQP